MPKLVRPKNPPLEGLPKSEWRVVSVGVFVALLFAGGLGLLMFALQHYGATIDPDARNLVITPDYPRHLIDFSLTDQSGHPVTRADLDGKIVVVSFVFTGCSVVCPYVNAQMQKIQQLTAGDTDVKLISLTLDPADDSSYILANYGRTFGEDPRRWSLLTGDETVMRGLIGTSFLASDSSGQFASMPGNFSNSQRIVLVDAKGQIVDYFDGLNSGAADAVVGEIKKLRGAGR